MTNIPYFTDYEFENKIKYLIWSTGYYSPTENLKATEQLFVELKYQGVVTFDLLLCNGNNWNRFCTGCFDGEKFSKFEVLKDAKEIEYLKYLSSDFYYKNPEFLENSILSKAARFLIRKGRVI